MYLKSLSIDGLKLTPAFKKDVMESSSWNITKPLRKITKIINRK